MPILGSDLVETLNLQGLLDRLGVRGIARFRLLSDILPVAVVDGSIQAIGLQTLDVPFTAGELSAPAAATRLANTGALVAGQYNMTIIIMGGDNATAFRIRRRNAGDTADVWSQRVAGTAVSTGSVLISLAVRVRLLASEFIVVENAAAGTAAVIYQASIWVQGPF